MSFLCIPGVFGRRKDRETDDIYLADTDPAQTGVQNATTGRNAIQRSPSTSRPPSTLPSSSTPERVTSTSPSLFHGANTLQFEDFRYVDASRASNVVINSEASLANASQKGWELLAKYASPNAMHNSRARHDPPHCDEGTRVGILGEIMDWMKDRTAPCRLLCMTGAAGSGKSALQQTVAEINNVSTIIPTIAYQLGTKNSNLRQAIGTIVKDNPLIFDQSLGAQIHSLITQPYGAIPHAILIDGVDECNDEGHQVELIRAIHTELLLRETPFRPELALRTALQPHGHLHGLTYHIRLSDVYDATADIRRTLWRRLREVGACSSFPSAQDPLWPPEEVVETIVKAASGQYIYVATVIRYVSERRASPVERLRAFLAWSSSGEEANPFVALDLLYTNILSPAGNKGDFCILLQAYAYFFNPEGGYFFPVDTVDKSDPFWGSLDQHQGMRALDQHSTSTTNRSRTSCKTQAGRSTSTFPGRPWIGTSRNACYDTSHVRLSGRRAMKACTGLQPPGYPWLALVSFTLLPYLLLRGDGLHKALVQFTKDGGWGDVTRWMEFLVERSKRCDINIDSAAHWYEFLDRFVEEVEDRAVSLIQSR
ncbi:hypothetical protein FA13DRAFT_1733760 [Coprinellus micaceus]|uniref:Nephrocystin 3-like N-terminal domain-containing protein n=1 Tax=Coprinellus micaceus TaxID=71717 RepID=A0A4Y7T944_COPMI|nr:hypothetical protein FA13DRAFT_1733760 [Coprinellus micaceus]